MLKSIIGTWMEKIRDPMALDYNFKIIEEEYMDILVACFNQLYQPRNIPRD